MDASQSSISFFMSPNPTPQSGRNATLDVLRGLASLAVCWFHLTNGNVHFLPDGLLKASGAYGWLGVDVFFVISGFIIPFALSRADYHVGDYPIFLLKRVLRLDPPYLVAIGVIIGLGYLSSATPGFQGQKFNVSLPQLLSHLGYANAFLHYQWLSPVFWTLAIEVQYYLLVGLFFPLLADRNRWRVSALMLPALILPFLIPQRYYIFHWLFLFMMGIATFRFRRELISLRSYLVILGLLAACTVATDDIPVAATAMVTACIIAFTQWSKAPAVLLFLGHISYSLYLLHVPVGGRVINLGLRLGSNMFVKALVLSIALAASIAAAWALHRWVELPAQKWSSARGYRRRKIAASGFAPQNG
ncbi:MAG: acyltransferase [Chthoniobacterales bacterium]